MDIFTMSICGPWPQENNDETLVVLAWLGIIFNVSALHCFLYFVMQCFI